MEKSIAVVPKENNLPVQIIGGAAGRTVWEAPSAFVRLRRDTPCGDRPVLKSGKLQTSQVHDPQWSRC